MRAINQHVITSELPIEEDTTGIPISVQYGNDFAQDIANGLSTCFRLSDNGHGKETIVHDPCQMHYFAEQPGCFHNSTPTIGRTPFVENSKPYDLKVNNLEELRKLKEEFLTRPFMLETFFEGEALCGNTVGNRTPRTCLIATINPQHSDVYQLLQNAFDEADEYFQKNENFSIEISVFKALKGWFSIELYKDTGVPWFVNTCAFGGRWHISIYNNTPRIIMTNYPGILGELAVALCSPCFCLYGAGYSIYRRFTCNTINVELNNLPFFRALRI